MGAYDFYGQFCTCPPRRVYIPMRERDGDETPFYPVNAYDVNSVYMGTAADKAAYIALWNSDADNRNIGTLYGSGGPFAFFILVNSGQVPPLFVLGDYGSTPVNLLPTANAGSDQTITLPTSTATLSGSGIDPDGTIASYAWTKLSGPAGGAITSPSSASTGLTALQAGTYVYKLTVTDDDGGTADDTVSIVVNPATFSFLTQPSNQTVAAGVDVTITAAVQNGTPNYTPRWYKNGVLVLTQSAQSSTSLSATFTPADGDQFYVTVTDAASNVITSNTVTITVTAAVITVTYGWSPTDPFINNTIAPTVSNPATQTITHNANITINYGSTVPDNYIVIKVPAGESVKTSFNNGTYTLVGGPIEGDEIRAAFTVAGFRYYVSRNQLPFDYTQPLNFIS